MRWIRFTAGGSTAYGILDGETITGTVDGEGTAMFVKVVVPVTSLCPCSKAISDYGAHNQRSHVTVEAKTETFVWVEELIDVVESEASCELYGLLKRPDEKYVTEKAYCQIRNLRHTFPRN